MLGPGLSSESIWTAWESMCTAVVRKLKHVLRISWTRGKDTSVDFAVVGTSVVGGIDIIKGLESAVTHPDYFDYFDESEYALRMEYDRWVDEPQAGIALCLADILLDNTDLRFTPNQDSTIGTAILPNRPLKADIGFEVLSQSKTVPVFKGLTKTPTENKGRRTLAIPCIDYIKYMDEYPLEKAIYTNQRADQIIEDILTTVGFSTEQYVLDEGLNIIGFAWFEKGETAGARIRKLCEAEEGYFYQDEMGMLRFENRRHYRLSPHAISQHTFQPDDILHWEDLQSAEIINKCIVRADPREVQPTQEIWRHGIVEELDHGEVRTVWANFEDPVSSFTDPLVATTDYVANTKEDGTGEDITSDITVVLTTFTKDAKLVITNASGGKAFLTLLRIRGTPATITSEIVESYDDSDSQEKYGRHQIEIRNDFIDDRSFAYYLARAIVEKYKESPKRLRLTVRGCPHFQLKDKVTVIHQDQSNLDLDYRIMRIRGILAPGEFRQILDLRRITDEESDCWAIVGTSTVGGDCVVGI